MSIVTQMGKSLDKLVNASLPILPVCQSAANKEKVIDSVSSSAGHRVLSPLFEKDEGKSWVEEDKRKTRFGQGQ